MNKNYISVCVAIALQSTLVCTAQSAENIRPAGPIGGTDIRQAILPPAGVYGVGVAFGADIPKYWTEDKTLDTNGYTAIVGAGAMVVYDTEFLGGALASTLFLGYEKTCFQFKGGKRTCVEGQGDAYSDILMWSRNFPLGYERSKSMPWIPYGLNVLVGLGVQFPTGNYDSSRAVNTSANVYDFAPNFALTYVVPSIFGEGYGDATEFSARVFYNLYTKNHDTDYQTGDLINTDIAVSQRFGQWQLGITANIFAQIEDDRVRGVVPDNNGNRAKSLGVGPVVSYDFMWDKTPWNITVKSLFGLEGENTSAAEGLVVRIGRKFL